MSGISPDKTPIDGSGAGSGDGSDDAVGDGFGGGFDDVGGKVARGAAWIGGGGVIVRMIGLINTLIIARLLTPDDFGVVAIGVTVTQLLQNISDIGVAQAVVRYRQADRRELDTLFTLSLLRGLLVMAILWAAAAGAGAFYEDERVGRIFLGMGAVALLQSLFNPKLHEFQRDLDFSKEVYVNLIDKVAAVIASIAIALVFKSYWAIVAGLAAGATARLIVSYAFRPYLPRISLAAFRDLIGFTGWLTGVSFMAALNNKIDALFLGRILGPIPTGLYYMGTQLAWLPGSEIAQPIAKALYPGLSSLQDDPRAVREAFLRGVEALGIVALPAAVGCAFVAEDMVSVLLGAQWADAAPIISLYGGLIGLIAVYSSVQEYAVALGKTRAVFIRETTFFLIRMPIFIWASITYGLMGAVWSLVGLGVLHAAFNGALYAVIARANPLEPLWRLRRSIIALLALATYFLAVKPLLAFMPSLSPVVRLAIDVSLGAGFYAVALFGLWRLQGAPNSIERAILKTARFIS